MTDHLVLKTAIGNYGNSKALKDGTVTLPRATLDFGTSYWPRHRVLHMRENRRPFEEMVRHLYFEMAIYDKDSMEMLGAGKAFDHTVEMVKSIEWLTDEDRYKIFEGNARRLYPRTDWH